jgi:hypothetical protein
MISGMAPGEPGWLAWLDSRFASALSHYGLLTSIVLAAALAIVAVGVFLPARFARAVIVLALVVAVALWMAHSPGGIFTDAGTNPNSGPIPALMALPFWPLAAAPGREPGMGDRDWRSDSSRP